MVDRNPSVQSEIPRQSLVNCGHACHDGVAFGQAVIGEKGVDSQVCGLTTPKVSRASMMMLPRRMPVRTSPVAA